MSEEMAFTLGGGRVRRVQACDQLEELRSRQQDQVLRGKRSWPVEKKNGDQDGMFWKEVGRGGLCGPLRNSDNNSNSWCYILGSQSFHHSSWSSILQMRY